MMKTYDGNAISTKKETRNWKYVHLFILVYICRVSKLLNPSRRTFELNVGFTIVTFEMLFRKSRSAYRFYRASHLQKYTFRGEGGGASENAQKSRVTVNSRLKLER